MMVIKRRRKKRRKRTAEQVSCLLYDGYQKKKKKARKKNDDDEEEEEKCNNWGRGGFLFRIRSHRCPELDKSITDTTLANYKEKEKEKLFLTSVYPPLSTCMAATDL